MINAAIIGMGWWGKTLVESAAGSDRIRFVAGVTRTVTPQLEVFARTHGLRLVSGYEVLLADRQVDAVVLATPHSLHCQQMVAAAKAGKHVFCEKPFTMTKAEAQIAVDAARSTGIALGLGYNRRFHPEMIKLREMIRTGGLGTILHVEATMTFANVLFIKPGHWRADPAETPLGGLMPMGVHAIDAMIDLCGPVDRVFAQGVHRAAPTDVVDTTSVLLRMRAGMTGYLGTMTTTGPGFSFQVFGSKGWVRLEGKTHVAGAPSEERRMQLFGTCRFQPIKGEASVWQAAELDICRAELEAFAEAAGGGAAFPIPYDQMIHGPAVAEAIIRSAASGALEHVA